MAGDALPILQGARGKSPYNSFIAHGYVPASAIAVLIGEHPDRLGEGFAASEKPDECEWMNHSRTQSITSIIGTIWSPRARCAELINSPQ